MSNYIKILLILVNVLNFGIALPKLGHAGWEVASSKESSTQPSEIKKLLTSLAETDLNLAERFRQDSSFQMVFSNADLPGVHILLNISSVSAGKTLSPEFLEADRIAPLIIKMEAGNKPVAFSIENDLELYQAGIGGAPDAPYQNPAKLDVYLFNSALMAITDTLKPLAQWRFSGGKVDVIGVGGESVLNVTQLSRSEAATSFQALNEAKLNGDIEKTAELMSIPDLLEFQLAVKNTPTGIEPKDWLQKLSTESLTRTEIIYYLESKDLFAVGVRTDFPLEANGVYIMARGAQGWKFAYKNHPSEVNSLRKLSSILVKFQAAESFYKSALR